MAKLIVIYWRDIPSQVVVRRGRETHKVMLSDRFQKAIDRAAMRAGKVSSEHYLADWRRAAPIAINGDGEVIARDTACQLEQDYTDVDLLRLIRAHGQDQASPHGAPPARPRSDG